MKFNLNKIKNNLMIKYPLFGIILANTTFVENDHFQTAATDGKTIYYNSNFLNNLNEKEQTFVLAHEICHIAFDHIFRSEGKNKKIWNIATDAVVNALLQQDGLPIVAEAINIEEAINYNAEEMYEKLLKEEEQNNYKNSIMQANSEQDTSEQINYQSEYNEKNNNHNLWENAVEIKNNNIQETTSKEKHIKKLASIGEIKTFEKNKIIRKKQLKELMDTLSDGSHGLDLENKRNIHDIGESSPLIDWRILLKEAIKFEVDWSYKNATIEKGIVTPHLEELPKPETEIILDTSGSINKNLLKNFLRECKNILKTSDVKVGCFDDNFYGFTQIRNTKDIDNISFIGGGGTNFDVAVNAFTKRVENKIIFTDGYANMPSKTMDITWVVFGDKKISPKGGKVIYIDYKQLQKLYSDKNNVSNIKR